MNIKNQKNVDVVLIYPIWPTLGGKGKLQKMLPPIGILSIASYLEENGLSVAVIDVHGENISIKDFRKHIKRLNPKFVGISVLSAHLKVANNIADICKEELSEVSIIAGGVHAEIHPEHLLSNKSFDAVGSGDGEELMLEFVQGKNYKDIEGLVYLCGNSIVRNRPRPVEMKLDKYPFPAYHLVDLNNYFPAFSTYRRLPAINLLMTRGCPGKCTFCNSAQTVLRGRTPEKMVELIKILRYQHNILQFSFYDDTFTAHKKNVIKFCNLMIEQKVDATWICYVRGDMFDDNMAKLMSDAGCHHILIGIETGSETLMKEMKKSIDKEKYKRVVEIAHKYNMEVRAGFIFGHLNETHETMEETFQFAVDLDIDYFQPSIMTPYPGTRLFAQTKQQGLLLHEDYERYGQNEVVMKMAHLSTDDVINFVRKSYFRFYLRPKIFFYQFKRLRSWQHVKDLFYAFYITLFNLVQTDSNSSIEEWLEYKSPDKTLRPIEYDRTKKTPLSFEVRQKKEAVSV